MRHALLYVLLTAIAALCTHFILLRAPLTTDLSSWRAPAGVVLIGSVLLIGLAGCYLSARAAHSAEPGR